MSDVKILKSIDITSYTIMGTGIGVLFSVLFSIILLIAIGILNAQSIGVVAYIIPTIIVGTIMCSIYNRFAEGYLYNWLTKRMNPITFELNDEKEWRVKCFPLFSYLVQVSRRVRQGELPEGQEKVPWGTTRRTVCKPYADA